MEIKKMITQDELALKLQMSKATIHRKVKSGVFKKYALPNSSKVYFDEEQIMQSFAVKN